MNIEELYTKASFGDEKALEELIAYAEQGEADAQYLLSCLYEMDGPFKNEEQAYYWLDIASYNGNQQAKQKLQSRPIVRPTRNKSEVDNVSDCSSDEPEYHYVESEEENTRNKIRLIWWIAFPIILVLYYMNKCERDAKRDKAFQELIKPLDQKSDNFNPQEHLLVDSNLKIKVDKDYIEHLEKRAKK